MALRWYVIQAYSGFEKSVRKALLERIERAGKLAEFGQIIVPVEDVIEVKNGQRVQTERKILPGYVLIEMEMNDETWHLVKSTSKISSFVGGSGMRPTPLSAREVESLLAQMQEGAEKPKPKVQFEVGQALRVKEGPFADFDASVEEVNYDKNKLKVLVTIFGRATPVEVDFTQVEKV